MTGVSSYPLQRHLEQARIEGAILDVLLEEGITNIGHFNAIDRLSWKESPQWGGSQEGDPTLFDDDGTVKANYYEAMRTLFDFIRSMYSE